MIVRFTRLMRGLTGLSLLAVFPVGYVLRPWLIKDTLPVCLFRLCTGKPCCFCGLTRSLACAVHGELATAYAYNPLWWLAALIILVVGGVALRDGLSGSDGIGVAGRHGLAWGWYIVVLAGIATVLRMWTA